MRIYLLYGIWVIGAGALLWQKARWTSDSARRRPSTQRGRSLWLLAFGGWAIALIWWLWHGSEPYRLFGDFTKAYYFAGQQILSGTHDFYGGACVRGYVNIPIVALGFVPLAQFSPPVAGWLMAGLGAVTTALAGGGLLRLTQVAGWRWWALIGLFVANGPLHYNLRLGNTTQYVLLLLIAALSCGRRGRPGLAGALVAIAAVLKIPILLLGGYFLLRGHGRALGGFILGLGAVVGGSILLFGPELHGSWYTQCIQPFVGKPLSAFNVQSVDGFLARLWGGRPDTWVPLTLDGAAGLSFKLWRYGLLAGLVGAVGWTLGRRPRRARHPSPGLPTTPCAESLDPLSNHEISQPKISQPKISQPKISQPKISHCQTFGSPPVADLIAELEWVTVLCLALLISPISWTHYYLLLLLPLGLLLGNPGMVPPGGRLPLWLSVLSISLPVTLYQPVGLPWIWGQVWLSHYFWGGVLLLGVLLRAHRHLAQTNRT